MNLDEARALGVGAKVTDPDIIGEGTITYIDDMDIGDVVCVEYPDEHGEMAPIWYDNDLENGLQYLQAAAPDTPRSDG